MDMEQTKYDVFISYSRKDYADNRGNVIPGNEVSKIMDALSKAEISFWFDKEGVIHGEDFGEKILKYIKRAKIFVYLSTSAANESEWTRKEIASAVMYKKKIIPVRIDESPYHDSVMFRIADLDYINYEHNPQKGREELVESILRYKAEERAAAARREAEEQRHREEQERQYRQQEELRRRQQQADELRVEISKTEDECSDLEKTLLLKQHDLGVVSLELESKRKHLEEQKQQMNAILFTGEPSSTKEDENALKQTQQVEDEVFSFCWSRPRENCRTMWKKIKVTMHARHIIVNVILCLTICFVCFCELLGFALLFEEIKTGLFLCASMGLSLYALWQILLNKRSGVALLLMSPILSMPISFISAFHGYVSSSFVYFCGWRIEECLAFIMCFYITIGFVLLFLLIRKKGKTAWSLLEGKFIYALQLHRYVGYYLAFALLLFLACCNIDYQARIFLNQIDNTIEELRTDYDYNKESLDTINQEMERLREELQSKEIELNEIKSRYRMKSIYYKDSVHIKPY